MSAHMADPKKPFHLFYIGTVSGVIATEQALVFHKSYANSPEAQKDVDADECGRVWFLLSSHPQSGLGVKWSHKMPEFPTEPGGSEELDQLKAPRKKEGET